MSNGTPPTAETVKNCQQILAHAWMVRTFVKHSPEVEEFPELMTIVRTVFDLCRAVESRVPDPPAYMHQLRKKLSKLRAAAAEFERDAPLASTHTNFEQAVISINRCVTDLTRIVGQTAAARPVASPLPSPKTDENSRLDLPDESQGPETTERS